MVRLGMDWLRRRQNAPLLRAVLDGVQRSYEILHGAALREGPPAVAGGRAVRCIPLPPPQPFTRSERRELVRAANSQGASFFDGHTVRRFETELAHRFGARHVLATSSGTAALHTAMIAIGIGEGDEVVVPAFTYVATALAVLHAGGTPVFVDAEPETWNLDPRRVAEAVTPRTRAIVPVHIGGVACDMEALLDLAERHDLWIVEDAAHAHGSTWRGRALGTIGDIGCFSFGAPKSITTGEGGALMTSDPELARRARMAMNLGECTPQGRPTLDVQYLKPEERLEYALVGWNYRMSTVQAAVGLGQLRRFDSIRARRSANGQALRAGLARIDGMVPQAVPPECDPCWYTFPAAVHQDAPLSRAEILQGLARERIDFRLMSNRPLPSYPIFGAHGAFPVAEWLCRNGIGFRVDPRIGPFEVASMLTATRRLLDYARKHGGRLEPEAGRGVGRVPNGAEGPPTQPGPRQLP